uniref:Cytochrome P450 52C2 n=1 Tax=Candida maltosa TaxID=5479 RepID=CP52Q_CANMA|nr:RecName: Full=Cytochrome P450 52C2; AltName: Full=Alkane-inducible P450-ALK6-A; AltName: Full=CYPLIIC2 [Candida maltosa]BAA02212.1 n-alkane inducible cytochrome P-450 [Candida maltosa]
MIDALYILIVALVIYKTAQFVHRKSLEKKHHCQPVKQIPLVSILSGLGFDMFFKDTAEMTKNGGLHKKLQQMLESLQTTTFRSRMLTGSQIVTMEPENERTMCSSAHMKDWTIGYRPFALKPLLGDGIFSSEGESWKHSRIMLRPIFAKEHIKQITAMEPYMLLLIEIIKSSSANEGPVDLQPLFHAFTIDYASDFLFGESCDVLKENLGGKSTSGMDAQVKRDFASVFNDVQNYLTKRMMLGPLAFLVSSKDFHDGIKKQHEFVSYFVQKAISMSDEELNDESKNYVFLYQLAKQTKDAKVLQDELLSILLAGRNTTASLLSFLFFELSHHENVWTTLKEVVDQSFPDVESITFETIQNCDYLRWCLFESLRVNPSVPFNSRTANKDTILPRGGGEDCSHPILVKKGDQVLFPLYASNRQEKYFGRKPEEFIPERWRDLPKTGGPAFMPFSTGPRMCLGQQFALIEASYVTIRLVQTFSKLKSHSLEYAPKRLVAATIRLIDGCFVSFE